MKKNGKSTRTSVNAIQLTNITKKYMVHHQKPTLAEQLIKRQKRVEFTALKEVSITVGVGEKVGIIGDNGSGKTTLLKIISGITAPNAGSVQACGKIVSLIDLEAGFHPDLTGEENIFLNGLITGMTKEEIIKNYKAIVAFADIGSFIDAPLYTYSDGMKLRLGFAVAIYSNPDILILDEGISVGDNNFREKSSNKIEQLFKKKKTIVIVSHWLDYLKQHCSRIIWLDKGIVIKQGPIGIIDEYLQTRKHA